MLILLPPSETKREVGNGNPFDPAELSFPELDQVRTLVREHLTSIRPDTRNLELANAAPIGLVYSGAMYRALDLESLDQEAAKRADDSIVVLSALWGALRPNDEIPKYRLHICHRLPGLDHLPRVWQEPLEQVIPGQAGKSLIVDFRAGEYAEAWQPAGGLAERTVVVKVLRQRRGRGSASFNSLFTCGLVARHLVTSTEISGTAEDLAESVAGVFDVEVVPNQSGSILAVVEKPRSAFKS